VAGTARSCSVAGQVSPPQVPTSLRAETPLPVLARRDVPPRCVSAEPPEPVWRSCGSPGVSPRLAAQVEPAAAEAWADTRPPTPRTPELPSWAASEVEVDAETRLLGELHYSEARQLAEAKLARNAQLISRPPREVEVSLEEIDLLGGNGSWRKRRAEVEFERRRIEEEEQARLQRLRRQEQRRRREEQDERARREQELLQQRRRQELERIRLEKEERERRRLKELEEARLLREEAERQRLANLPITCQACSGTGLCQTCFGKGTVFGMFLAPQVAPKAQLNYGKFLQGCTACGGTSKNILGRAMRAADHGDGRCAKCRGVGKVRPNLTSHNFH